MKITSFGAAGGVTGSKHLLEINGYRILLDCGMFQGRREEAARKNRSFPFSVDKLHAVVLSHAHIDHTGTVPMLHKHGYNGRIYTTPATLDLCGVMLLDSANIQRRDAEWLQKKNREFVAPLYSEEHVYETMRHLVGYPYNDRFEIVPDVFITFQDAGHVLGSAMVVVDYKENGVERRLLFSGDLGRKNMPLLQDPWIPEDADIVIMESTYGDRDHDPIEAMEEQLAHVVLRAIEKGGKIIIPSFALERAQEIVFALKRLEMKKAIPSLPVYVDSPLTVNITEIFRFHTDLFDTETKEVMKKAGDPFELNHIEYVRNMDDSMRLNSITEPCIIISASGMCEVGRILHHLRNNCEDPKNTILIVGFMAENTLGRRIVERRPEIKIFGVKRALRAEVKTMNAFSAHAGRSELIDFGARFHGKNKKVLLVHGEPKSLNALQSGLQEKGVQNTVIMEERVPIIV
ncbi:MAG: MBL fold metallo-hydrolase [Candidatus Hydrogenedentes bacterium]|jgi:metallo-beta-lactamase family protein|nr:MBL fold metallo-hydrolase [Candidatus Hydrogenedentota bacterium]